MQQLYYTNCPDDKGFAKQSGFNILAASCRTGADVPPEVTQASVYPAQLVRPNQVPPIRWASGRQSNGERYLIRSAYVGGAQGGREGNYFSHALYSIPEDTPISKLLAATNSSFWLAAWQGEPGLPEVAELPDGELLSDAELTNWLNSPGDVRRLAELLTGFWLSEAETHNSRRRLLYPATGDSLNRGIQFLTRVLPPNLLIDLTFTTLEQRDVGTFGIVTLPEEVLKELRSDPVKVHNFLHADKLEKQLSDAVRKYVQWVVARVADGDWSAVNKVVECAAKNSVKAPDVLAELPDLIRLYTTYTINDFKRLWEFPELARIVPQLPQAIDRILELVCENCEDAEFLKTCRASIEGSNRAYVERKIAQYVCNAAVEENIPAFEAYLNVWRDYCDEGNPWPVQIETLMLKLTESHEAGGALPAFPIRRRLWLELPEGCQHQRLKQDRDKWLATTSENECADLLCPRDRLPAISSPEDQRLVLRGYLSGSQTELRSSGDLAEWICHNPGILAGALQELDGRSADKVWVIIKMDSFPALTFVCTDLDVSNSESAVPTAFVKARAEVAGKAMLEAARAGEIEKVRRLMPLLEVRGVSCFNEDIRQSLKGWSHDSKPILRRLIEAAKEMWPRHLLNFVNNIQISWLEYPDKACLELLELWYEDESQESLESLEQLLSRLSSKVQSGACLLQNSTVRRIAIKRCVRYGHLIPLSDMQTDGFVELIRSIVEGMTCGGATTSAAPGHGSTLLDQIHRDADEKLLLDDRVLQVLLKNTLAHPSIRPILDRVLVVAAKLPQPPSREKSLLLVGIACKVSDSDSESDSVSRQGLVDFGRWILEKEMRDGEGFQTHNESLGLINRLSRVTDPELGLRLRLREIVFKRKAVTLADYCDLTEFLDRSESSYKDAVRKRLKEWWENRGDEFVGCFLDLEKTDCEPRISHLDLKFSSLLRLLGKADWYAYVIEHFVELGGSHIYQDYRAVAATLFPLFRDPVKGAEEAARLIARRIFPLSFQCDTSRRRGTAQENADRIYDSYRTCLANLPDERHESFEQLCKSEIDKQMRPGNQKKLYGWGLLEYFPFFGGSR